MFQRFGVLQIKKKVNFSLVVEFDSWALSWLDIKFFHVFRKGRVSFESANHSADCGVPVYELCGQTARIVEAC